MKERLRLRVWHQAQAHSLAEFQVFGCHAKEYAAVGSGTLTFTLPHHFVWHQFGEP